MGHWWVVAQGQISIITIAVTNVGNGGNSKVEATLLGMDKLRWSDIIQFRKVIH
jgi:hypothetical protein